MVNNIESFPREKGELLENNKKQMAKVTGYLAYRQRIALPAGAVITIKLADVSRQDVAATILAEQTIVTQGEQVSIPFTLSYTTKDFQANHIYIVQAQIRVNDRLMFTTTQQYTVLARVYSDNVELMLEMALQN